MSEVENIRIDLKGEHLEMFSEIMKSYKKTQKTDTIKLFIEEGYKLLASDHNYIKIEQNQYQELKELLNRNEIKRKLAIYNVEDYLKHIIREKLLELRGMRLSLTDWEVTKNLNEFDLMIATAIKEYEMEHNTGVTADQVAKMIGENPVRIEERLEEYYYTNYLERITDPKDGTHLYHTTLK